jgi:hypothetical protein
MSIPQPPLPVKPVVSLILTREDLAPKVINCLSACFGPPDLVGPWWPFNLTDYYYREMGAPLGRILVSFLHLADPGQLAHWKVFTNAVEARFSLGGRRLVNLDPGLVAKEKLVLATGKNYTHRLYLDRGIYGDVTLVYARGKFQPLPWSYPDYAQGELPELLERVRRKYLWQLKELTGP